jgi:FeS assembly protein IscX
MKDLEPPLRWTDYDDIAASLYERFGPEFTEDKIYTVSFADLQEWVLQTPNFAGTRNEVNERHLEMIKSSWVTEWRGRDKPNDAHLK